MFTKLSIPTLVAASAFALSGGASASTDDALRMKGVAHVLQLSRQSTPLDSRLAAVAAARRPLEVARRLGLARDGDRAVRVVVAGAKEARKQVAQMVRASGGRVELAVDGLTQALVPPDALTRIARSRGVRFVRPPARPVPLAVLGEGVQASNASAWQVAGLTGKGVKVAVIDAGFGGLAQRQSEGEIPSSAITVNYCGSGFSAESHGTAVAEIVAEEAPGAQLYLICMDSDVTLAAAEQYAEANGIRVVNHSIGWYGVGRGDGSGPPGSPDAIVAAARTHGILWVNAAGNDAANHWGGTFVDANANGFGEFAPGDDTESFYVARGGMACAELRWDDWPDGVEDYDVAIVDPVTGAVVARSADNQHASAVPPIEEACFQNGAGVRRYDVVVRGVFASRAVQLDLFVVGEVSPVEYSTAARSIADPAASPNVLAVGADCWFDAGLEPFSSQGPTIDGRTKPDLVAYDSVSSATYGGSGGGVTACGARGFVGTSAAAPYVAGAAALVAEGMSSSDPSRLQTILQRAAVDQGPAGADNSFGAGRLRLPDVLAPLVASEAVDKVGRTDATVAANVDPRGWQTNVHFEYGTTAAYGSATSSQALDGGAATQVTADLGGLRPSTTYHFRAVATNRGGTANGPDQTLVTLADLPPVVKALPANGKGGAKVSLRFRVSDDTGAARARVDIFVGPIQATSLKLPFANAANPVVRVAIWRAPRRSGKFASAAYRFCVHAWDRAGHASKQSCAPVRLS